MKTILSILLCFGFVFCKGQKDTSLIGIGLVACDTCHFHFFYTAKNTPDTISCVMLVTDTCNCYHGQMTYDFQNALRQEGFSYYLKGYCFINNDFRYSYLDADKKPLSKNIVVWMSMSTKTVN